MAAPAAPPAKVHKLMGNKKDARGKYMVATKNISAGSPIHSERPLVSVPFKNQYTQTNIDTVINNLSQGDRAIFQALMGRSGDLKAGNLAKFNVNAFGYEVGNARRDGIFPELSRINHSCQPNAGVDFAGGGLVLYAWAYISVGEEISVSYRQAPRHGPWPTLAARQAELQQAYGLDCACFLCQDPSHDVEVNKLTRLRNIVDDDNVKGINKLQNAAEYCRRIEGGDARKGWRPELDTVPRPKTCLCVRDSRKLTLLDIC